MNKCVTNREKLKFQRNQCLGSLSGDCPWWLCLPRTKSRAPWIRKATCSSSDIHKISKKWAQICRIWCFPFYLVQYLKTLVGLSALPSYIFCKLHCLVAGHFGPVFSWIIEWKCAFSRIWLLRWYFSHTWVLRPFFHLLPFSNVI